jgi:hypothetical protein
MASCPLVFGRDYRLVQPSGNKAENCSSFRYMRGCSAANDARCCCYCTLAVLDEFGEDDEPLCLLESDDEWRRKLGLEILEGKAIR